MIAFIVGALLGLVLFIIYERIRLRNIRRQYPVVPTKVILPSPEETPISFSDLKGLTSTEPDYQVSFNSEGMYETSTGR